MFVGISNVREIDTYRATHEFLGEFERTLVNLKNLVLGQEASFNELKIMYFVKSWTLNVYGNDLMDNSKMVHFRNITNRSIFKFGPLVWYKPEAYPFTSKMTNDPVADMGDAEKYFFPSLNCNVIETSDPTEKGIQFTVQPLHRAIHFYKNQ